MRTRASFLLGLLAAAGLGGCAALSGRKNLNLPPEPVEQVDAIEIMFMPAGINLDNVPGPDALRVRTRLYQLSQAQPVTVSGTLEFLLFEGDDGTSRPGQTEPFHVWTFPPEQLRNYLTRTMVGWAYAMELGWGPKKPKTDVVTLMARYTPPEGEAVYSKPQIIPLGPK